MGFEAGHDKSRGKRRHVILKITLRDIAEATGYNIKTIRRHIESGKLNLDLKSVAEYIRG